MQKDLASGEQGSGSAQSAQKNGWRPRDTTPIGIRFVGEHTGRGMHIPLEQGTVQAFPDDIYITSRDQIERTIPILRAAGVEFQLNHKLNRRQYTLDEARHLVDFDGWYNPDETPRNGAENPGVA